ncbi:MAG: hypothetical protein ABIW84_00750, partial [Ilumatobacteraceae bacterium]
MTFAYSRLVSDSLPESANKDIIHKWSVGIVISPASNYRKLSNLNSTACPSGCFPNFSDSLNEVEQRKTVFNFGIVFSFFVDKHFALQTGISYLDMGYRSNGWL